MAFNEMQTEVQDNVERTTDMFQGSVTTTPTVIQTSTGRAIQISTVYVPTRGDYANTAGAVLLVSWDGTNYHSYPRGDVEVFTGKGYDTNGDKISVKAYSGTVKYEIKLVS